MSIFLSHKDVWICECVNVPWGTVGCKAWGERLKAPHGTSAVGDPAKARGWEIFFWKKCRKNLEKGKCLTYLCIVNRKRHKPYTKGIAELYKKQA